MMRSLRLVPFRLLAFFGIPFSLFLVGILGGSAQINAAGIEFEPLQPSSAQVSVSRNIARGLEYSHFRSQRLDQTLSSQIFDNYLKNLDNQRVYFLEIGRASCRERVYRGVIRD